MRLVYLIRDLQRAEVRLAFTKPKGVRVSKNVTTWYFRDFDFQVGQIDSRLLYNSTWDGPIGVFNVDKAGHLKSLFEVSQVHTRSMLEGQVLDKVGNYIPIQIPNISGPNSPEGFQRTAIAKDIIKIFRHGDENGKW